ncbi:cytochrome c oxidase assembly factor CtaG [Sphingomonas zeicaulis]|uniref:hypothetical protein n=1 Tax=Sphingomonas zeicaulis TaxID=1632740 RepID=UPI003D21B8C9
MLRIIFGFLLAPMPILLPILWFSIIVSDTGLQLVQMLTLAAFIYGPTLLFGVPAHVLLRRFGKRRLWHYLAAAMTLPVLATLAVFIMEIIKTDDYNSFGVPAMWFGSILAIAAALTALLFWLIAIWRSPEPGQIARTKLSTVFD